MTDVTVVGAGMAGSEAAWQLAEAGLSVALVEMKPCAMSPAHQSPLCGELVCSNSLRSDDPVAPAGLLKHELRRCGSMVIACADRHRVPAGQALAVERFGFARQITQRLALHPRIRIERRRLDELPDGPVIVCTGPLTEGALGDVIRAELGGDRMYFYDAIAPIVAADSLDQSRLFAASRYGKGGGDDYLNAPLDASAYEAFVAALLAADRYPGHDFEGVSYFEGCLPIEEMAARGRESLRFGPMKPVGLADPATGRPPHAVVQLRREDRAAQMWNLVGFQTRLRTGEQRRVFSTIPGLESAEFLRYGSIHRNSYINSPAHLTPALALRDAPTTLIAGQLTGVEGYTESLGTGLLAGINLARLLEGGEPALPPPTTMLGALMAYLRDADPKGFQPMNANFGLLPPLEQPVRDRTRRKALLAERALEAMRAFARDVGA